MNEKQYNPQNDEIDIIDLLVSIWKGRWFISAFVVVSLLISAAYVYISSDKIKATIEIYPITEYEFIHYNEINEFFYHNEVNEDDPPPVNRDFLVDLFVEKIKSGQATGSISTGSADVNDSTLEEADLLAAKIAGSLAVTAGIDKRKNTGGKRYVLEYSGDNSDLLTQAFGRMLSGANSLVFDDINNLIEYEISTLQASQEYALKDLQNEIESLKVLYRKSIESRIAFLKEQSRLARALGIEQNTVGVPSVPVTADSLTVPERDITVYLRGYKALDKEIELIQSRSSEEPFIPGIAELRMKMDKLQRDDSVERVRQAINRSPLGQPSSFSAASYDLNKLTITPVVKAPLVMALGLMLGLMLGVLALGLKNALASRAQA